MLRTRRATLRWTIAISGGLLVSAIGWWVFENALHQDKGTALSITAIIVAFVCAPLLWWAQQADSPAPQDKRRRSGTLPEVWNVPAVSSEFTGRDGVLTDMRQRLTPGKSAAVALHGINGVGKSQLAAAYAHKHGVAGDYDLVWWVNAENEQLIDAQLTALATTDKLRLVPPGTDIKTAVDAVRRHLRGVSKWLVVFDNAGGKDEIKPWIPQGPGHVVITTHSANWSGTAARLQIDLFSRAESVALLTKLVPHLSSSDADTLADQLGDLPLALEYAAGFMVETVMPASEYLGALKNTAAGMLDDRQRRIYPVQLAAAIRLALDRLLAGEEAAWQLAVLCATLGPDPIPLWLLSTGGDGALPAPLMQTATNVVALRECVGRVARFGLITAGEQALTMHRLTQDLIRDSVAADRGTWRRRAEALLIAARPTLDDRAAAPPHRVDPALWQRWRELLPHVLAVGRRGAASPGMRDLCCEAVRYLIARGDIRNTLPVVQELHQQWLDQYGPADHSVLVAADLVAQAMWYQGEYEQARVLQEQTLVREKETLGEDHPDTFESADNLAMTFFRLAHGEDARRHGEDARRHQQYAWEGRGRVLGPDHRDTLMSADHLAIILFQLGQGSRARQLQEDTLARQQRVLGVEHPDTLLTANNLGTILRKLGNVERDRGLVEQARRLHEQTLGRRRRVLGDDHPDTLWSAYNLALTLHELGQNKQARLLQEDTLARRRRVLGARHPESLASAGNLAAILRALGRLRQARLLEEDTRAQEGSGMAEEGQSALVSDA